MKVNTHFSFVQLHLPNVRPGEIRSSIAGGECLVGFMILSQNFFFPSSFLNLLLTLLSLLTVAWCCCWLFPYCCIWGEVNEEIPVFKLCLLSPIFLELLCLTYMICKMTIYKLNFNLSSLRKVYFSFLVPNLILFFEGSWILLFR